MYGDFPAKSTVYTPYIPIIVWFWPTLDIDQRAAAPVAALPVVAMYTCTNIVRTNIARYQIQISALLPQCLPSLWWR